MKIQDGKGKNGDMSVSATQRGNVSAKTAPRAMYASRDDGLAYAIVFEGIDGIVAGSHVAYVKNVSSTRNMFIDELGFGDSAAHKWKYHFCSGTAAAGTVVTPTSLNRTKNIPAEVTAMTGTTAITGLTVDGQLGTHWNGADEMTDHDFDYTLILGPGDAFVVELDTATSVTAAIEMSVHFESIGHS